MTPTFRYALGAGVVLATVGMHLANALALDSSRVGNAARPAALAIDGYVFPPPSADDAPGATIAPTCAERPECASIASYAARAAFEWVPMKAFTVWGESEEAARARILAFAESVATVALDPDEAPLFAPSHARERTALFLTAQAAIESGFAAYVQDGRCNDAAWRASAEAGRIMHGDCDYSITPTGAWTVWQIHVDEQRGVMLTDNGWLSPAMAKRRGVAGRLVHGHDVIADPVLAARVALHWLRATPEAWGSSPYARQKAEAWFAKHPPPAL